MTSSIEKLKTDWLLREQDKLQGKKGKGAKRQYLHFDRKIREITPSITNSIWSSDAVKQHSFYPFIQVIQKERRRKKAAGKSEKKFEKKERPISYAAHFDALLFSWYSYVLEEFYETQLTKDGLTDEVIAYRKLGKSNIHFAEEAFKFVANNTPCTTIALDISGFFDNLNHEILKKKWAEILLGDEAKKLPDDHYLLYKVITKFCYANREDVFSALEITPEKTGKIRRLCMPADFRKKIRDKNPSLIKKNKNDYGIPQGAPISAVLANLYLLDFDRAISTLTKKNGGFYRRYSDDILIICKTEDAKNIEGVAHQEIAKVNLKIKSEKTEIRHFQNKEGSISCSDGTAPAKLQYLGLEFDGIRKYIRHRGIAKFERKMTRAARSANYIASQNKNIFPKRSLYERFSHLGKQNYISYTKRVARILGDSSQIKNQTVQNRIVKKIKTKIVEAKLSSLKRRIARSMKK